MQKSVPKRALSLLLTVLLAFGMGTTAFAATTISLNPNSVSVKVGETVTSTATVSDYDATAGVTSFTTTSNDTSIATVSNDYTATAAVVLITVTGATPGTTTIAVSDNDGGTATLNVTVTADDDPGEPDDPGDPEGPGGSGDLDEPDEPAKPSGSGSSSSGGSSSGGGGGGGGGASVSAPAPTPVNTTTAVNETKKALAEAKNSPDGATVNLKNVSTVSLATLKEMVKAAGNTALKVSADSLTPTGGVDVRITIDPSQAKSELNLSASTTSGDATSAARTFEKHFNNTVSVVSLSQKGNFGMPVRVAAKFDKKLNPGTLVFYAYDKANNKYTQIKNPQYKIDKNGYVHFTTSLGGEIVISDKPLKKK